MGKRTHKVTGWTREYMGDGSGRVRVTPTDGSEERIIHFLMAGSWANLPGDARERQDADRWILESGPALPEWAEAWMSESVARDMRKAREAFQAAVADADWNESARDGW